MIELEKIKSILEDYGVECSVRTKLFIDPSLDYDYIKCEKDGLEFETSLKDGDLPVLQFVCILNGKRFGLNYMFSPMELTEDLFVDYIVRYSVDHFINNIYKQTK